jgi:hypothetical protein
MFVAIQAGEFRNRGLERIVRRPTNHHALKIPLDAHNPPFGVSVNEPLDDLKCLHRSSPGAALAGNLSADTYTTNIPLFSYYKVIFARAADYSLLLLKKWQQ